MMNERENQETLERFWRAHERGDPDALAVELHEQVEVFWPQSGERIRGKANLDAINRHLPGGHPTGSLLSLRVFGNFGILEMKLEYGSDVSFVVELIELKDTKVYRATEYFAAPFEAPAWRSQWVDQA